MKVVMALKNWDVPHQGVEFSIVFQVKECIKWIIVTNERMNKTYEPVFGISDQV